MPQYKFKKEEKLVEVENIEPEKEVKQKTETPKRPQKILAQTTIIQYYECKLPLAIEPYNKNRDYNNEIINA